MYSRISINFEFSLGFYVDKFKIKNIEKSFFTTIYHHQLDLSISCELMDLCGLKQETNDGKMISFPPEDKTISPRRPGYFPISKLIS
ncbi:CLUMA_CG018803, isoform A [Clunio marinus]|uniref:CLUMA_CG018803, isoform A n=1 Tax=Clunio marinus TaxID=568069 RepID=A0A1J1J2U9_9DIPT|nr:CLUMA_CG018803, isoform A [Clunio marinus]